MITVSAAEALDPQPIVRLRSVSKTFSNGTIALTGLDLDVGRGEFLSLLGRPAAASRRPCASWPA